MTDDLIHGPDGNEKSKNVDFSDLCPEIRDRINKEAKKHSIMLGQIAEVVYDWCEWEECTTLDAVKLMKAELLELRSYKMRREVEDKYER